ncbi:MAG: DUF3820 family protein [Verrucomicrobia bacterium]|nr:DUF3820 family protein [Verrucomicrobiota bacterium]
MRTIFYDLETTGVRNETDQIVEIAAYDPQRNATFVSFVRPQSPIPPEATAIHKISDEMVADAPSFGEIAERFSSFCEGEAVLVAHNNDAFDRLFLRAEYSRCNVALPGQWRYFDTLKWARRYLPHLPRHSLQFLREYFGIEENNAHRALDDVQILYQIYTRLVDDLPIQTVLELLEAKKGPSQNPSQMPFGKYRGKALHEMPKTYVQWLSSSGALDKAENSNLKESLIKIGLLTV